jgi:hypothetical protein
MSSTRARTLVAMLFGAASLVIAGAGAHAQHHGHGHSQALDKAANACNAPTLACATKVTPTFAADGALWIAYAAAQRVMVARSTDLGRSFEPPIEVTPGAQQLDWGPDSRPKIVVDAKGRITVAYAVFKDKAFNGQVFVAQSEDARTFTPPRPITTNAESQRFEALGLDADGRVFVAWLDKRNRPAAKARGEKYAGAAFVFTWLDGSLATDESRVTLAYDNTCECCRMGVAFAGPGRPAVIFRNIFPGSIRDHAIVTFETPTTPGPIRRVSDDGWKTDACPHHGPSLAISEAGTYHAAWYTAGAHRQGLFYARSEDGGAHFSAPMPIGAQDRMPSRPTLVAHKSRVFLAWKEFDGQNSVVLGMRSQDDGRTWSKPERIASTEAENDHPLLVMRGNGVYLSWHAQGDEGYRLIQLDPGS